MFSTLTSLITPHFSWLHFELIYSQDSYSRERDRESGIAPQTAESRRVVILISKFLGIALLRFSRFFRFRGGWRLLGSTSSSGSSSRWSVSLSALILGAPRRKPPVHEPPMKGYPTIVAIGWSFATTQKLANTRDVSRMTSDARVIADMSSLHTLTNRTYRWAASARTRRTRRVNGRSALIRRCTRLAL